MGVTTGTIILLGFGLGALVGLSQRSTDPRSAEHGEKLRERAIEAQRASAEAARRARDLTALWQETLTAAGKQGLTVQCQ